MNIYGYADREYRTKNGELMRLAEVTLVASPEELRSIASFLVSAAESMERMGGAYGHEHLADRQPVFGDSPEFIVSNPLAG